MPKILILTAGQGSTLVDALAVGARAVRFSEVEVRQLPGSDETASGAYEVLAGADEIVPYDAIILGVSSASGTLGAEYQRLLRDVASVVPRAALQNKLGAAFLTDAGGDVWPALVAMGDMGMLIAAPEGNDAEAAKALGGRVAQVAAMIAHVRSHHHAH